MYFQFVMYYDINVKKLSGIKFSESKSFYTHFSPTEWAKFTLVHWTNYNLILLIFFTVSWIISSSSISWNIVLTELLACVHKALPEKEIEMISCTTLLIWM